MLGVAQCSSLREFACLRRWEKAELTQRANMIIREWSNTVKHFEMYPTATWGFGMESRSKVGDDKEQDDRPSARVGIRVDI